ncbi:MAG: hypothetical protein SV775_19490 [Thermodesulfobacteriota bacterium]|nr:hypothetical protein [Thermodesulfobacteriota bacterium]
MRSPSIPIIFLHLTPMFLLAAKLDNKKAESLTIQSIKEFWRVPTKMRQTLIVDNGKEYSRFRELKNKTGFTVKLCKK